MNKKITKRINKAISFILSLMIITTAGSASVSAANVNNENKYASENILDSEITKTDTLNADETDTDVKIPDDFTIDFSFEEDENTIRTQDDYLDAVSENTPGMNLYRSIVLPSSVDNSNSEYFPEIRTQGGAGSCTCWSMVYYQFTYMYNKLHGIKTTSDNSYSPAYIFNFMCGANKNQGSHPMYVYATMKKYGNATLKDFPYYADDPVTWPTKESIYRFAADHRINSYQTFANIGEDDSQITSPDDPDLAAIKTALANGEVLSFGTCFGGMETGELKRTYAAEANQNVAGQKVVLHRTGNSDHAMTIVGYDDTIWTDINNNNVIDSGEMGALKIANSHGKGYANNGFVWVAYDALNKKSCVQGAVDPEGRDNLLEQVNRVILYPETRSAHQFMKFTANTDDRYGTNVYLIGKWANKTINEMVTPNGIFGSNNYYAYDGSKNAVDATFVYDLEYFLDQLGCTDPNEVEWSIKVNSKKNTGHSITVKNLSIYDESTGRSIDIANIFPITVEKNERTELIHNAVENNAIIYYRGYKDPVIKYTLTNFQTSSETVKMTPDLDEYGYVYRCVIPMKNNSSITYMIGDGNGRWDDNKGEYFTAKKGNNYCITENVGEPFTFNARAEYTDYIDVGCKERFIVESNGGYEPHEYKIIVKNKKTGETEYDSVYEKSKEENSFIDSYSNQYQFTGLYEFKKEGTFEVTVVARDSSGEYASKVIELNVVDDPLTFTDFHLDSDDAILPVNKEIVFSGETVNDGVNYGNRKYSFGIYKDQKLIYSQTTDMSKGCIIGESLKRSLITVRWTPRCGGEYYAYISRVSKDKECAFKWMKFTVAGSDVRLNSVTITPDENIGMGEKLKVKATASGGDGKYKYQYSYIRYGKETIVQEFTDSSSYDIQLPFETGPCDIKVVARDSAGIEALYVKSVWLEQPHINDIRTDKTTVLAQQTTTLSADVQYAASSLTAENYVYTVVKDGVETVLTANSNKTASWRPSDTGVYTIKLKITTEDGTTAFASKKINVEYNPNPEPESYKIKVGIIYYINDRTNSADYKIHYWNNNNFVGDAKCVNTGKTENISVGSAYWGGAAQKFYIYEATVPKQATGFKFHIGDRWFGANGALSSSNAVYIFEYSGDKCLYKKE